MVALKKFAFVVGSTQGVGRHLVDMLCKSQYTVRATYRKEEDKEKLSNMGAEPIHLDLADVDENELAKDMEGYPNVFFTAGSKGKDVWNIDRDGAVKVANAMLKTSDSDSHLILLSGLACDQAEKMGELEEYGKAKFEADQKILQMENTRLKSTIVRPGGLTDDPFKGKVIFNRGLPANEKSLIEMVDMNEIVNTRTDVANVMLRSAEIFKDDRKSRVFEMINGNEKNPGQETVEGLQMLL